MKLVLSLLFSLILASFAFIFSGGPALGYIDDPDSVSLYDMKVYRHLLEDDDYLAVVPYSIEYGTSPGVSIDKTFIFRLIDPDSQEELGTALAFPYINDGYGDGIVSFYFSADTAPTWSTIYHVYVNENPSQFEEPSYWSFTLPMTAYSAYDTQEGNQSLLQADIIAIARDLETAWSIDLLGESEVSTVLSDYGEAYFRNSIYGLQSMCPDLFSVEIVPITPERRDWDYSFAETFYQKYAGTFWGDAITGFAGLFNTDESFTSSIVSFFICILIMGAAIWKGKASKESAFLDGFAALGLFTLLGSFSFIIHGLVSFLCAVAGAIVLFLNRS